MVIDQFPVGPILPATWSECKSETIVCSFTLTGLDPEENRIPMSQLNTLTT